jgi:segregation and condensation protein A
MYQLNTEKFSGPLQKLLELIEEKKLIINEFSLAEITADFLDYVKKIEEAEPRLLADFVAVAAKLLLIKSRSLLPDLVVTSEEKEEIMDLETRLRIYQQFRGAGREISRLWDRGSISYSRELLPSFGPDFFYPPAKLTAVSLREEIEKIYRLATAERLEEVSKEMLNFEKYLSELSDRIKSGVSNFKEATAGRKREEIIVLFLALLHLLKDNRIKISQEEQFSDILISSGA